MFNNNNVLIRGRQAIGRALLFQKGSIYLIILINKIIYTLHCICIMLMYNNTEVQIVYVTIYNYK